MDNKLIGLLGVSDWVANSFPTIRIVLMVLTVLCCAFVIVLALIAPAGKENGNVITGGQMSETFYSQNKSHMNEGLIKKLMIIFSIATAVLIILFFVTVIIYRGN
jgi:preprotein translocase secG subunit